MRFIPINVSFQSMGPFIQQKIQQHFQTITKKLPRIAIILGSGLKSLADHATETLEIPYANIENFPRPSVPGHQGKLIAGMIGSEPVIFMQGRTHYYECQDLERVTYAVRFLHRLGITALLITNAAGALRSNFEPGELMLIEDHINLIPSPLLRSPHSPWNDHLPLFVDLSQTYDVAIQKIFKTIAASHHILLHSGVYAGVTGPQFETPAEVKALNRLGADAVGMSTTPEVIMARALNMRVAAISGLTNKGAGMANDTIHHDHVLAHGQKLSQNMTTLCFASIPSIAQIL